MIILKYSRADTVIKNPTFCKIKHSKIVDDILEEIKLALMRNTSKYPFKYKCDNLSAKVDYCSTSHMSERAN